uniref:Protein kinase domain-containing protein n=1 Tax=Biomphalaria glabrata TaxID=6526 RepID=A0A2C9K619_BIOGL
MPKHYVDNAFNRSLGRVGMEHGTAVYSRSSGSFSSGLGSSMSSSSDNNYGSYSGSSSNYSRGLSFHVENPSDCYSDSFRQQTTSSRHSDLGSSVSSGGSKTYVDNAYNRSLGRVGLEHGTAVHHRDDSRAGSSSSSSRMYADNALNRSLDRVGLELGTAVHHKESSSTSSSSKTYVDNAVNRSLGRVGLEHGTAVQHKENQSSSSSSKTYVDNAVNRSLGRVGLEHGTAVQHKKDTSSSSGSSSHTYVDNAANRKLGRVGLEHGTAVQHKADKSQGSSSSLAAKFDGLSIVEPRRYKDNNLNRKLGRVGKPLGAVRYNPRPIAQRPVPCSSGTGEVGELLQDDEIPDDIVQFYDQDSDALEAIEAFMAIKEREENVRRWLEEECETTWDAHQHTSKQVIENYKGVVINCSDLIFRNKLGNGNFGKVFLAEWVEGQLVAVKVLKNQSVSKRRLRDFEREILLYCELDHENIVQFLGACTEIPHLAIVMEYMDISLYEALHIKEVDISLDGRSSIMRDVARGLSYLHSKGIAHCDLKSHNVLLNNIPGQNTTDTRFPMIAKLTDFGLSFMKSDSESSSSLSDAVKNIGTPKYSAPEVLRGELLNADAMMKADVYSLGLTIVEILLEEIPFDGLNLTQLQKQVGEKGLKPKVERGNILIPEVKSMLIRCCNRDPDQRPTARELSAFCERYPNVYKKECR